MFGFFQAIVDAISSVFGILFNLLKLLFSAIHIVIVILIIAVLAWIVLHIGSCVSQSNPGGQSVTITTSE